MLMGLKKLPSYIIYVYNWRSLLDLIDPYIGSLMFISNLYLNNNTAKETKAQLRSII